MVVGMRAHRQEKMAACTCDRIHRPSRNKKPRNAALSLARFKIAADQCGSAKINVLRAYPAPVPLPGTTVRVPPFICAIARAM